MRFVSSIAGGYRVYAVTGTNTVSFGVDFSAAGGRSVSGRFCKGAGRLANEPPHARMIGATGPANGAAHI